MPDDGRRAAGCREAASSGALAPRIGDRRSFFQPVTDAEETAGRAVEEEVAGRKSRGDFPGGEEEVDAAAGEDRL